MGNSNTSFCVEVVEAAINEYGAPEIFNTDQGCQYTSKTFTQNLTEKGVKISMDGRGRALDNIMIERFWGSLKREKIYINEYSTVAELKSGVTEYINFYNNERPHQSLKEHYPSEVYNNINIENYPWETGKVCAA